MRLEDAEQIDPLHENLGCDDEGHLIQTTDFDFDAVDRGAFGVEPEEESVVSFADMSAALSLIVGWICASPDLRHCGSRAAALACLLDPIHAPHGRSDLTAIAKEAGVTKAATSKWLVDFRDQVGTSLTIGKRSSQRDVYRRAQNAAYALVLMLVKGAKLSVLLLPSPLVTACPAHNKAAWALFASNSPG